MKNNLAESIRARLLNLSKSEGSDFSTLLTRYALERFLYRISQSEYVNLFLLKGAQFLQPLKGEAQKSLSIYPLV